MKNNNSEPEKKKQFTWMETVLIPYLVLMYFLSVSVSVSIIIDKCSIDDKTKDSFLYIIFFIVSHIIAGLTNLALHRQEILENRAQPNWITNILLMPISPIIRYQRAWCYGRREAKDQENGERFVGEAVIVGALRLIESILGDATFAILMLRDDVWNRSDEWELLTKGPLSNSKCNGACYNDVERPKLRWKTIRLLILISQIGQSLTLYKVMSKRFLRLSTITEKQDTDNSTISQGRTSFIGCIVLFGANYTFIGSRLIGYSQVFKTVGFYVLLVIILKWLTNTFWHLFNIRRRGISIPNVCQSFFGSFVTGGVWLFGLTNERDESQFCAYVLFYFFASVDTAICSCIWYLSMRGSGDFFVTRGIWATLVAFGASAILVMLYYLLFHSSRPILHKRPLNYCTKRSTDPLGLEGDMYRGYRSTTYAHYKDSTYYIEQEDCTNLESYV